MVYYQHSTTPDPLRKKSLNEILDKARPVYIVMWEKDVEMIEMAKARNCTFYRLGKNVLLAEINGITHI
jgi:hypothetical protein